MDVLSDALGAPIDGKGEIEATDYRPIEQEAPGIVDRKSVSSTAGNRYLYRLTPCSRSDVDSVSLSLVTVRPVRLRSRWMRS